MKPITVLNYTGLQFSLQKLHWVSESDTVFWWQLTGEKSYSCAHKHQQASGANPPELGKLLWVLGEWVCPETMFQSQDNFFRSLPTSPIRSRLSASYSAVPHQPRPPLLSAPLEGLEELLVPSRGTVHLPNQHGHRGNRTGFCHTVDGLIKNLGGCSGHQQSQLFQLWFILVLGQAYEPGSIGRT